MNNSTFTLAEANLMILYNTGSRIGLLEELGNMLTYLAGDEIELRALTLSAIRKLEKLSDIEFAALDLEIDRPKGW